MRHVTWPTRSDVRATTTVVIITVFFFGFLLWLVDLGSFALTQWVQRLIRH